VQCRHLRCFGLFWSHSLHAPLADVQRNDANQRVWLATVGEAWVCLTEL
jgi:hypothetical protein